MIGEEIKGACIYYEAVGNEDAGGIIYVMQVKNGELAGTYVTSARTWTMFDHVFETHESLDGVHKHAAATDVIRQAIKTFDEMKYRMNMEYGRIMTGK